jgi:hypothetical protein
VLDLNQKLRSVELIASKYAFWHMLFENFIYSKVKGYFAPIYSRCAHSRFRARIGFLVDDIDLIFIKARRP